MANLTVWKFNDPEGADRALDKLGDLVRQQLIQVQDAAVVKWEEGKKKPKTRQAQNLAAAGALSGAFWGMLFGLIFFIPLFGMAVGAAMGGLSGKFADFGIDDSFIDSVQKEVTPGTSALFVLSSGAVEDKVREAFKGTQMELIKSNLSEQQEQELRAAFSEEE